MTFYSAGRVPKMRILKPRERTLFLIGSRTHDDNRRRTTGKKVDHNAEKKVEGPGVRIIVYDTTRRIIQLRELQTGRGGI